MILQDKVLEGFDKYYHPEVIIQEDEAAPVIGKAANRNRKEVFLSSIIEFRSVRPLKVAIGEGTTMVQWYYDYTHKELGNKKYTLVAVQQWRDGKIVKEQCFYSSEPPPSSRL
ncbi:nuclear transport factor 2 family protein [Cesiribacter sp. SM1]|uniref:nuclear transport factor 2 family protein n=1 Tax=Cesiribacter sp. SM1 TaxID=2861196 RepID=UPI001CD7BC8E|nr:nuclear transport factor 2 family protein [Cesiribacter sp. SM1]